MSGCPYCKGGWLLISNEFTCAPCYGRGSIKSITCYSCKGTGLKTTRMKYPCPHCNDNNKPFRASL
jgi:hypothetical protein